MASETGLHDRPVLVLDPGFHTAPINRADTDAAGRIALTGSDDRTVRVWDVESGACKWTIRLPQGPGHAGKVYAVALSPDGSLVAAGGSTQTGLHQIYIFSAVSGALRRRIGGLPNVVLHLAFSPDGQRLAATRGGGAGLRLFDVGDRWAEIAADADYGGGSYGAAFAPDGRLATTCEDGDLQLYSPDGELVWRVASGGEDPLGLAFDQDGGRLAVGFDDSTAVRLFDGRSLSPLAPMDTSGLDNGDLSKVTWSADGATLFAAGRFDLEGTSPVIAWDTGWDATPRTMHAGRNTVMSLCALPDGDLLVASGDPWLGRLGADGTSRWCEGPRQIDPRGQRHNLGLSGDGMVVDFGVEPWSETRARFDLETITLSPDPADDGRTAPPVQNGSVITEWIDSTAPKLSVAPLMLDPYETSRSLAMHPDGARFLLGADWSLRAFTNEGQELWRCHVPGVVWAVNISGDGRLALAACADGTLRWHDMESGAELLALFPLPDRVNWVAWTPEGAYSATNDARSILRWHVNRGWDRAGQAIPVSEIPETHRPEVIRHVLPQMGTAGALAVTELAKMRGAVRRATGSDVTPGARLHVLAIGVSRHGKAARHLDLDFAHQDALDVAAALRRSQSSLNAEVVARELVDADATRMSIFDALASMRAGMEQGGGNDVGVVLFCGHGDLIDGDRFYLFPHGIDDTSTAAIKGTGLPATDFHEEIAAIARHGRVLVFLDACRAGGAANLLDRSLRAMREAANVTVFSSSSAGGLSHEHADWQSGAFTEALLEGLQHADFDHDGLISVSDLAEYLDRRVPELTNSKGVVQRPDVATSYSRRILATAQVG